MELLKFVCAIWCLGYVRCGSESYKAALVDVTSAGLTSNNKYAELIHKAGSSNVDLLVLPPPKRVVSTSNLEICANELDNFDEVVKSVSMAAKNAQVYVVAPLHEKITCQDKEELIMSSMVFDRTGALVCVHRKPVNSITKCNTTTSGIGHFSTDFGVTFGIIAEEDLTVTNPKEIKGVKNFVIINTEYERSFLNGEQFSSSWAYVNNVNVISANVMITGKDIVQRSSPLVVAIIRKIWNGHKTLIANPPQSYPSEDLSYYVTKPLNLEASAQGYSDSVCQGRFCCQFYIKASIVGASPQAVSYGLVAFDGFHQSGSKNIAVQTCSVMACAGLYKRSCSVGSKDNSTNVKFSEISITANFSKENSEQFPNILTTSQTILNEETFKFTTDYKDYKYVSTKLYGVDNILTFGIIGRDYSQDFDTRNSQDNNSTEGVLDFTEYISNENVQEFFDYVWIRLRVLIVIVSVYILEMM